MFQAPFAPFATLSALRGQRPNPSDFYLFLNKAKFQNRQPNHYHYHYHDHHQRLRRRAADTQHF